VGQDRAFAIGYTTAAVGPLAAVSLLKFMREQPLSVPLVVLVLLGIIVVSAVLAGPIAGFTASLIAALSFDFLFVTPYRVLKLSPIDELWPAVLLLVAGVSVVWVIHGRWQYSGSFRGAVPRRGPNPSLHVQRVALLIERRADVRDVIAAVQAELTGLLVARSCRFDSGHTSGGRPRIERDGSISGIGAELELPPTELELPVRLGRHSVGRFLVDPTPGVIVPFHHRIVAVILTDHLAAALVSDKSAASPRP
jgi:hypothetical protein